MSVADLMPLVHARDSAEAKVAAIGSVNPRAPGPLNAVIQVLKRTIARGLDWFVRDQVVFNREVNAALGARLNTNLLFPVYDDTRAGGSNMQYHVIAFVGFHVTDFRFNGSKSKLSRGSRARLPSPSSPATAMIQPRRASRKSSIAAARRKPIASGSPRGRSSARLAGKSRKFSAMPIIMPTPAIQPSSWIPV